MAAVPRSATLSHNLAAVPQRQCRKTLAARCCYISLAAVPLGYNKLGGSAACETKYLAQPTYKKSC